MKGSWSFDGWHVVERGATLHRCSKCGRVAAVPPEDQYGRWLNWEWTCPQCGDVATTKELNSEEVR